MAKLAAADDKGQGQETWGCCRDAGQREDVVDELGEADPQRKLHGVSMFFLFFCKHLATDPLSAPYLLCDLPKPLHVSKAQLPCLYKGHSDAPGLLGWW